MLLGRVHVQEAEEKNAASFQKLSRVGLNWSSGRGAASHVSSTAIALYTAMSWSSRGLGDKVRAVLCDLPRPCVTPHLDINFDLAQSDKI